MITNLENEDCNQILNNNYIGHLAYIYLNKPFVVPITYFYDQKEKRIIGYTGEGHKTHAMQFNNNVAIEIPEIQFVNSWKSVMVRGTYKELTGVEAKYELHKFTLGVKAIIEEKDKNKVDFLPQFSSKTNSEVQPIVYVINIQEIIGKERKF